MSSKGNQSKYAKHKQEDPALAPPEEPILEEGAKKMTLFGRILIFLGFPTLVGIAGLYMGYLATRKDPLRSMKFDTDFAMPFMITLTMAIVIGFQTKGYTSNQVEPLVQWPKVRKRKTVIHRHVFKGKTEDDAKKDE